MAARKRSKLETHTFGDNEQHFAQTYKTLTQSKQVIRRFFMPQTKFQDVVFTILMATCMVYAMITYNVALDQGGVTLSTFSAGLPELAIMMPIAFILEFFVVGKIAPRLAFTVMRPTDRPQFITYAISICICCIMCPVMSLIATLLFKSPTLATWFPLWIQLWVMNFPMAICWQLFYCGPLVRLVFRTIFRIGKAPADNPQNAEGLAGAPTAQANPARAISE
jgi:hypothetical protein